MKKPCLLVEWYKVVIETVLGWIGFGPQFDLRHCQNIAWPTEATSRECGLVEVCVSCPDTSWYATKKKKRNFNQLLLIYLVNETSK